MKTTNDNHAERLALLETKAELLQQNIKALEAKIDTLLAAVAEYQRSSQERAIEMNAKLDKIKANTLTTAAIGEMLIEAADVTKLKGLNPKTISANRTLEKFTEHGRNRILIRLRDAGKIKPRRRSAKES